MSFCFTDPIRCKVVDVSIDVVIIIINLSAMRFLILLQVFFLLALTKMSFILSLRPALPYFLIAVLVFAREVHSNVSNSVSIAGVEVGFSCSSSSDPPVWNRIKGIESVQSLAFGDRKMKRFKDER